MTKRRQAEAVRLALLFVCIALLASFSARAGILRMQPFTLDAFDRLIKVSERDSVGSGQDWVAVFDGLGRKVRTITTLVVSNTPITTPADAVSTVDSWFDPQVEFQEVGVVVNGGVFNMKTYGPDANGVHGGLQGVGGLERVTPFGHISGIGLLQDYFGNIVGSVTNALYGVAWNPARFSSIGPVPGYQPPALTINASLAQAVGWRGKHIETIGTFHWGARPYLPTSGQFLAHDPLFDSGNPGGFSMCGGDMLNSFDPDARFGKPSSGPEAPFSEYIHNAQHEALLDDLYGQRVTATDVIVSLVNMGAGLLTSPLSMAEGIGTDVDTAISGTYVNQYGLTQDASTGHRVFAGTMAAINFLPLGDLAEGGFQAVRGLGDAVAGSLDAAEDIRYGVNGTLDVADGISSAGATASLWQNAPPGIQVRQFGDWWVKRVNPEANSFMQWWGQQSVNAQYRGLQSLGDMATENYLRDGVLFTRDVGQTLGEGSRFMNPVSRNAWWQGSQRMGTFFNDIQPRNMGANGLIFDPAIDPVTRGFFYGGVGAAIGFGTYRMLNQ